MNSVKETNNELNAYVQKNIVFAKEFDITFTLKDVIELSMGIANSIFSNNGFAY